MRWGDVFGDPCGPGCAVPVPCPTCGNNLPPLGRAVPPEMNIPTCCDEARRDPRINSRHLWSTDELYYGG